MSDDISFVENTEKPKYSGYGYHGGGRKATGVKRVQIQFSLYKEDIEEIDEICEKNGFNRSQFLRECVKLWKETH